MLKLSMCARGWKPIIHGRRQAGGGSLTLEPRLEMDFGGCLLLAWAVSWVVCGTLLFSFSILDILFS